MTARIYKPAKTAMQSGTAKTKHWVLEYDRNAPRSIDPLMGYTSSGDMSQQIHLRFDTKEDAIAYAERNDIPYRVSESHDRKRRKIAYSDNFKYGRVDGNWTH